MHKWTKEQRQFVADHVKNKSNLELTNMINKQFDLNLSIHQVKAFKKNNKLSSGLDGRYKKGHIPLNKGLSWDEYMPKEKQKLCKKTTYKKGNVPYNHHPVGTEIERPDGYIYVKIAEPHHWKQKHRIIYEKVYGEIPGNYRIIFADGNKRNFDIENLVLVSNNELLIMNRQKLIYKDPELTKTGAIISKLINKTQEKEQSKNENKKSNNR